MNRLDGIRVLVVEDTPDIREVFVILLQAEGAQVVATGSGREAASLAIEREFDVVLSDLGLPDVPGDIVIRQIVATSRRRPRIAADRVRRAVPHPRATGRGRYRVYKAGGVDAHPRLPGAPRPGRIRVSRSPPLPRRPVRESALPWGR